MINKSNNSAVLITGGAKRLGREIALYLANAGYEIIIHANNSALAAKELVDQIRQTGGIADTIIGDLENHGFVLGLIAAAQKIAKNPILGLVNSASIFENDLAGDFTKTMWDKHFTINAMVPAILTQSLAQHVQDLRDEGEHNKGAVVNLLDQRVFRPNPLFYTYSLSKNALMAATKTMAQAFAPNLRVNAIAPGPSLQNARQNMDDFAKQTDATLLKNGSPPIAIAQAVGYFLTAEHVTGQIIAVDGGQSLIWNAPDIEGINE